MTNPITAGTPAAGKKSLQLKDTVVYLVFGAIFVLFSVLLFNKGFLTPDNLMNIGRQMAMIAIMSVGMTFVLCAAEIDLSFGTVVALSSIVTASILSATGNIFLAVFGGLGAGLLVGTVNGVFVAKVGIPSFLVTLGTAGIVSGTARWMSGLQSIPIDNDLFVFLFGSGDLGPVPILFFWTVLVAAAGAVLLKRTAFGRKVLATGGNKISALYSGIKVDRIKFAVMVLNSLLAAFAGILYAGRLHGARYTLGENDVMIVIAAVIIGGTSMFGGQGSVVGAVIGALIMGMLNNGLILMGLSVDQQLIFRGLIIIAAVSLTMRERKTR